MIMERYSMNIQWSDEDQMFLVTLPEWSEYVEAPMTYGKTYEEAVRNGEDALESLICWAKANNKELPKPHVADWAAT